MELCEGCSSCTHTPSVPSVENNCNPTAHSNAQAATAVTLEHGWWRWLCCQARPSRSPGGHPAPYQGCSQPTVVYRSPMSQTAWLSRRSTFCKLLSSPMTSALAKASCHWRISKQFQLTWMRRLLYHQVLQIQFCSTQFCCLGLEARFPRWKVFHHAISCWPPKVYSKSNPKASSSEICNLQKWCFVNAFHMKCPKKNSSPPSPLQN